MVVTDGLASEYLHLVLEGGDDWRTPLQKVFNEKLGVNWCFLVMELQLGTAQFHTLHAQTKPIKSYAECTILWLSELKQIPASQTSLKPKTNKKIVKKSFVDKGITETEANGKTTTTKTIKNSNGQKIARKKLAAVVTTVSSTTIGVTDDDTETGNDISVNSKKTVISKARNSLTNSMNGENYINGDGSADSGVSLVDSDTEKSSKCTKGNELDEHEHIPSMVKQTESMNSIEFAIPILTPKSKLKTTNNDDIRTFDDAAITETSITGNTSTYHNDLPPSFTIRRNNMKYEMNKKVGRIPEEEEKEKSEDWDGSAVELINGHSVPDRCLNGRDPLIRMRRSTPVYINSTFPRSFLSNGFDSLQR